MVTLKFVELNTARSEPWAITGFIVSHTEDNGLY